MAKLIFSAKESAYKAIALTHAFCYRAVSVACSENFEAMQVQGRELRGNRGAGGGRGCAA